jgi:hypothetical protein
MLDEEVPKTKRGWKFLRGRKLLHTGNKKKLPSEFPPHEQFQEEEQDPVEDAPLIEHLIHIDFRDGEDEEETNYYFDEYYHQVRTSSIEMILVLMV